MINKSIVVRINKPLPSISPANVAARLYLFMLLILPIHTQIIYVLLPLYTGLPAEIASIWKEVVLLLVAMIVIADHLVSHKRIAIVPLDVIILMFLGLMIIYVVASRRNMTTSLYGFRIFAEPIAAYYIAKTASIKFTTIKVWLKYLFYIGVIIGVWAIFQAAILGDRFLMDLGYRNTFGRLSTSFYISTYIFQRAVGTLSSPNTLGIFLQAVIMIGVYLYHDLSKANRLRYFLSMILLLSALLYTFSRSAWIALCISALGYVFMKMDLKNTIGLLAKTGIVIIVIFFVLFVIAEDVTKTIIFHIINALSLKDPAAVGHIASLADSFKFSLENPFGIGLGMSGPRASIRTGNILNSENSFFIIAFDMGIIGAVIYSLICVMMLISLKNVIKSTIDLDLKRFRTVALLIFIGQMVAWNLLPYIVELEATMILYALTGLALNHNLESNDQPIRRSSLTLSS